MAQITFITGGARSGKSRLAEELTLRHGAPAGYLATGQAGDGEMAARIARHQARRGAGWLTNLLMHYDDPALALADVKNMIALFGQLQTPLVLVSNEVGMGIVPDNQLARTFRDLAGEANELLAAAADEVYVTFSGLPLKL